MNIATDRLLTPTGYKTFATLVSDNVPFSLLSANAQVISAVPVPTVTATQAVSTLLLDDGRTMTAKTTTKVMVATDASKNTFKWVAISALVADDVIVCRTKGDLGDKLPGNSVTPTDNDTWFTEYRKVVSVTAVSSPATQSVYSIVNPSIDHDQTAVVNGIVCQP